MPTPWKQLRDDVFLRVAFFVLLVLLFQLVVANFVSLAKDTKRRCQHALTGLGLLQISYLLPVGYSQAALAVGCLAIAYLRHYHDGLYRQCFGPLLRPDELRPGVLPGAFYFLLGTLLVALCFPLPTARYAVACLSLADPAASWVGTTLTFGGGSRGCPSWRLPGTTHASVAGTLACAAVAYSLAILCFGDQFSGTTTTRAVAASVACALAEAYPVLNDNLSIPVATAAIAHWWPAVFGTP